MERDRTGQLNVLLPPTLGLRLRLRALAEGRSMNDVVRALLDANLPRLEDDEDEQNAA